MLFTQGIAELSARPHIDRMELSRNKIDARFCAFASICAPSATFPFAQTLRHKSTSTTSSGEVTSRDSCALGLCAPFSFPSYNTSKPVQPWHLGVRVTWE